MNSRERGCITIALRHCERPKGAWQSTYFRCIMRLLRSFHSLAITLRYSLESVKPENLQYNFTPAY
jgi:hypothetical protein